MAKTKHHISLEIALVSAIEESISAEMKVNMVRRGMSYPSSVPLDESLRDFGEAYGEMQKARSVQKQREEELSRYLREEYSTDVRVQDEKSGFVTGNEKEWVSFSNPGDGGTTIAIREHGKTSGEVALSPVAVDDLRAWLNGLPGA